MNSIVPTVISGALRSITHTCAIPSSYVHVSLSVTGGYLTSIKSKSGVPSSQWGKLQAGGYMKGAIGGACHRTSYR